MISLIFQYLCIRFRTTPCCSSVSRAVKKGKGALHIKKCLLTLCHLVSLNLGNSITQIKGIAEVGTAGRYMIHRPVSVRRLL